MEVFKLMILHEIVRALERVEEGQRLILERLKALESESAGKDGKWLEKGIDNILAYEAGKRKEN